MAQPAAADRPTTKAIGYSLGFAVLWAVLALVRPETTYHLAPPLVALAATLVYRLHGGRSRLTGLRLAAAGIGIAIAVTVLLAAVGSLDGPSLLPFGDAVLESLLGATAGGAIGVATAFWPQPAETT